MGFHELIPSQHHFRYELTGLPFIAVALGTVPAAAFYVPLVRYFQTLPVPSFIVPPTTPKDAPEMRLKLALFAW